MRASLQASLTRILVPGGLDQVGASAVPTEQIIIPGVPVVTAFHVLRMATVVLATGPCGRLGLPASGYLYGTYENPTNAGDGYSMAYHAGAELSADDLRELFDDPDLAPDIVALAEMMNFPGVVGNDPKMVAGIAAMADELARLDQRQVVDPQRPALDVIAPRIRMARARDREGLVEEDPRPCHHPRGFASDRIDRGRPLPSGSAGTVGLSSILRGLELE